MARKTGLIFGIPTVTALAAIFCVGVASGADHDFEDFARYRGCDSVVFNDRRSALNDAKNITARNETDKKSKEDSIKQAIEVLDKKKGEAKDDISVAEQCAKNRQDMFDHFKETAKLTESAGKTQMEIRQKLLDKLKEADTRREDAKKKRDAAPNDDNLKREYEKAAEEYRKVEQELGEFKKKNGQDIEKNYQRLVSHYADENEKHKTERENWSNRAQNCKDIANTSYSAN
jgi:DNA repair exonuclease SbcCD ATPase subunit